jgi:nucleoside-diphosphate kinase
MATNRTFTMIKPDAVANGHIGNILAMITNAGFKIILKLTQLTVADARILFSACCKTFLRRISRIYVKRRYCCCYFRKDNAVEDFRTLIGATNPDAAVQYVKHMLPLLEKMQFTVLTVMKMQLSKVLSILQEESSSNIEHSTFLVFS